MHSGFRKFSIPSIAVRKIIQILSDGVRNQLTFGIYKIFQCQSQPTQIVILRRISSSILRTEKTTISGSQEMSEQFFKMETKGWMYPEQKYRYAGDPDFSRRESLALFCAAGFRG